MKAKHIAALLILTTAGCAAPVANDETSVEQSTTEALTLQECATQRDTCYRNNPFFGLFTCPVQYTQCAATASNGIPAEVASAVTDAAACARTNATCLRSATTPAAVLTCTENEAECVAAIVDARLPQVVTGTRECIDSAVTCIRASETAVDLGNCADTLQGCAVDQAVSVLPPVVGAAVEDISDCLSELNMCTDEANSASELTQCTQDQLSCVSGSLGVPLPQAPVADAVACAEHAVNCTLSSETAADLRGCAADLADCNADIVVATVDCNRQWTQCLFSNPFAFFQCADELAACTAGE